MSDIDQLITALYGGGPQKGPVKLSDMTREEKNRYQREKYKARVKEPIKPYGSVNLKDMTKEEYNEYQRKKYRERNTPYRTDDIDIDDLDEELLQKIIDETSPPQKKKRTDDEIFEDLRQALMEDTPEKQYNQRLPPRTDILRISDITDI